MTWEPSREPRSRISPWGRRNEKRQPDSPPVFRGFVYALPVVVVLWIILLGIAFRW